MLLHTKVGVLSAVYLVRVDLFKRRRYLFVCLLSPLIESSRFNADQRLSFQLIPQLRGANLIVYYTAYSSRNTTPSKTLHFAWPGCTCLRIEIQLTTLTICLPLAGFLSHK